MRATQSPTKLSGIVVAITLILGAFGIGLSEFVVMGLLPDIAQNLMPERFRINQAAALAVASSLSWGYALGVVVGMIVTPLALSRMRDQRALLACASALLLCTVLTALSPTLAFAFVMRFIAALTHASFIGMASSVVATMLGPKHHGRGAALVVGGITGSIILGVPPLTLLGESVGWRPVMLICAVFFAAPLIALMLLPLPQHQPSAQPVQSAALRTERTTQTTARTRPPLAQLFLITATVTLIASACFTISTFVAPIADWVYGTNGSVSVAALMLAFGVGMNIGNFAGGWAADLSASLTLLASGGFGAVGSALFLVPAASGIAAGIGIVFVGISLGCITPAAQVLFVRAAGDTSRLGAALAPGTVNIGSFVGAAVGGIALASAGAHATVLFAIVIAVAGCVLQALRMNATEPPPQRPAVEALQASRDSARNLKVHVELNQSL